MATVRLCWVEPDEHLRVVKGEVTDEALREGALMVEGAGSPGMPGIYHLLSEDECFAFDPEGDLPVFLHDSSEANLVQWMKPLARMEDEVAAAEEVRKAVSDLVEARVAKPGVISGSIVTTTEEGGGMTRVVGRCVVIRPA